ncbi:poly-beta-1,6 N-acetyl-D-glucosamine export porin PgaA [Dongia sp.]|uniref:poly-beta-1,6 N-acetyl-D-glucosamine export porin PgaA n=1 Tax=Dongia sp. TaxID=1977262 RepID=UPI003750B891
MAACLVVILAVPALAETPIPPAPAPTAQASEAALLDETRAARDRKQFETAERLARSGMARFPTSDTWPVLLALILADQRRSDEALAVLAGATAATPIERKMAEAYALRRGGRPLPALKAYMDALRLAPDNAEARQAGAETLREIGGPHGAAALADPPLSLQADQAAAMVRWGGAIHPEDPAQRYQATDAALAELDRVIAAAQDDPALRSRLRLDRMVAWRDRRRMAAVVQEATALRAEGQALPPYAEQALADALLTLRRPKQAIPSYQIALAADPSNLDARYGLFYAQVEAEDFDAAYRTIDELLATQPPWRGYKDDPSRHPNPDYADAVLASGLARLYGDQLGAAQERVAPLAEAAPANAGYRTGNAQVMSARGWPRDAEAEARIAQSLDPSDPGIEKTLVGLDLDRHRYAQAEARIRKLQALYPEDSQVQALARQLEADQGVLFEIDIRPSWSKGGGTNAAGNELSVNTRLWSPPIDDHWRAFTFDDYSFAHPEEGFVERHHAGAGVELRWDGVTATAYGTYSTGELEKPGGGFTLDWWPNDRINLGIGGEIFSINTPLRALFEGTTANEIGGHATYRWHESREISLSASYLDFTDGNEQNNAGLDFTQRLVDIPHFDLTGRIELFSSANSNQDVAYYSPERDLTATAGLLAEHVLWRNYDDSLVQAFSLDAGAYAQKGFGTDWIGTLGYEHRWRFDPWTELRYGVVLGRHVFDGEPERSLAFTFGLSQRF